MHGKQILMIVGKNLTTLSKNLFWELHRSLTETSQKLDGGFREAWQNFYRSLSEAWQKFDRSFREFRDNCALKATICRIVFLSKLESFSGTVIENMSTHLLQVHGLSSEKRKSYLKQVKVSSWQVSCQPPSANTEKPREKRVNQYEHSPPAKRQKTARTTSKDLPNMNTFCDWLFETIVISVYDSFFRNYISIVLLSFIVLSSQSQRLFIQVRGDVNHFAVKSTTDDVEPTRAETKPVGKHSTTAVTTNQACKKIASHHLFRCPERWTNLANNVYYVATQFPSWDYSHGWMPLF